MICANVDMGSNTVRLSIYRYENGNLYTLFRKKKMLGLAAYVEDGSLSGEGIQKACEALLEFKEICRHFQIERVYVFATASLRNINNTDAAVEKIYQSTGFRVDVISGSEEARLDFIGVSRGFDLNEGILVDIGGGSMELVRYENSRMVKASSVPIGSLRLYKDYVSWLFPKKEERNRIKKRIRQELDKMEGFHSYMTPELCGVGGTARAALKLQNAIFHLPQTTEYVELLHIKDMIKILKSGDAQTLHRLLAVIPDRVHTILPGMMILFEVASKFKSKRIFVSHYGVREGYIYDRLEGKDHGKREGEK